MKKIITLLMLYIISTTALNAESITLFKKPFKIGFSFEVARPAFDCQSGIGICKLQGSFGRYGGDGRNVSGECYIENGEFYISIIKNYTTPEIRQELSDADYYIISEPVEIPQTILDKLGIKESYIIATGVYKIVETEQSYEITFTLR